MDRKACARPGLAGCGADEPTLSLQALAEALSRVFSAQATQAQFGSMSGLLKTVDLDGIDVTVELAGPAGIVRQVRLNTETARERASTMASQTQLRSVDVPQANELDRVFRIVELLAAGRPVDVMGLRLGRDLDDIDPRQVAYYRHAARILGLIDSYEFMGLTPAGSQIAALDDTKARLVRAAVLFELSALGQAWLDWAGKHSIMELEPCTAAIFLNARTEVGGATIGRRASTLHRWLTAFQEALRTTG
jgi:hypothetical protein